MRPIRAPWLRAILACGLIAICAMSACGGDDAEQSETVVVGEEPGATSTLPPQARGEVDEEEAPGGGPPAGKGDGEPERIPNPPPPGELELTKPGVTRLFEAVLGRKPKHGRRRVLSVRCSPQRCRVEYVTDIPGRGKIVQDQRRLWEKLFSVPDLQRATLVAVSGKKDTPGGGTEIPPALSVTCTREVDEQIEWLRVEEAGISALCRVEEVG